MAVAIATFLIALALIASERIHRTKIALLGAAVVVLFTGDAFDQEHAIESIDFNTIGLLAGMMILVYLTQQTGIYDYIAIRAGQISRGRPLYVVLALAGTTALLSAFLDNLTTILLVVPITFLLADALDIDPIPLVVIEVIASNIGGTATLIGDPPNIIIAGATDLSFNDFIVNLAPVVLVAFVAVIALLYVIYRPQLQIEEKNRRLVMELDAATSIRDSKELRRTVPVLVLTVLAFFAHQALHIEPATVALTGAAIGLLVTTIPLEEALGAGRRPAPPGPQSAARRSASRSRARPHPARARRPAGRTGRRPGAPPPARAASCGDLGRGRAQPREAERGETACDEPVRELQEIAGRAERRERGVGEVGIGGIGARRERQHQSIRVGEQPVVQLAASRQRDDDRGARGGGDRPVRVVHADVAQRAAGGRGELAPREPPCQLRGGGRGRATRRARDPAHQHRRAAMPRAQLGRQAPGGDVQVARRCEQPDDVGHGRRRRARRGRRDKERARA